MKHVRVVVNPLTHPELPIVVVGAFRRAGYVTGIWKMARYLLRTVQ